MAPCLAPSSNHRAKEEAPQGCTHPPGGFSLRWILLVPIGLATEDLGRAALGLGGRGTRLSAWPGGLGLAIGSIRRPWGGGPRRRGARPGAILVARAGFGAILSAHAGLGPRGSLAETGGPGVFFGWADAGLGGGGSLGLDPCLLLETVGTRLGLSGPLGPGGLTLDPGCPGTIRRGSRGTRAGALGAGPCRALVAVIPGPRRAPRRPVGAASSGLALGPVRGLLGVAASPQHSVEFPAGGDLGSEDALLALDTRIGAFHPALVAQDLQGLSISAGMGALMVMASSVTGWRKPSSSACRAWRSMSSLSSP